jgi:predicted enzyme related to lactoylglutathione lyase
VAGQGSAYFFAQEVDAIYESCSQKAKVIDPIGDRDYGLRDFLIEDPEGNRVGIAQRQ